jgi:hypothetical protein
MRLTSQTIPLAAVLLADTHLHCSGSLRPHALHRSLRAVMSQKLSRLPLVTMSHLWDKTAPAHAYYAHHWVSLLQRQQSTHRCPGQAAVLSSWSKLHPLIFSHLSGTTKAPTCCASSCDLRADSSEARAAATLGRLHARVLKWWCHKQGHSTTSCIEKCSSVKGAMYTEEQPSQQGRMPCTGIGPGDQA